MSQADRDRWDARHAAADGPPTRVAASMAWLPPARERRSVALDLACGTGRNTRALVEGGYRVVAADVSRIALRTLRRSGIDGSASALVQIDVDTWPFASASFDVIVQVDFLDRGRLAMIRDTVKPGGLLLIETFAGDALPGHPGPRRNAWRLAHGELSSSFADWNILRIADEPGRDRAAILARRPSGWHALR
jgi:SAM-dependent methyltransferase